MKESYEIQDLEQLRLLADPLKLKVIQVLAEGERTTKEVARALDTSLTRLYRHVDALHEAGLIEITRETPKRGTLERTFRTVAKRFEVDQALFAANNDSRSAVRDLVRAGEAELLQALDEADDDVPVFMRLRLKATPAQLRELRQQLLDWAAGAQALTDAEDGEEQEQAGALIAFYPISD